MADGQGHDVIADGVRDGEELVIIGPIAERYEFVRAAIRRTLPPVADEDQSLPFNQKLSHQGAQLLGLYIECEAQETQLVDRSQQEAVVAILARRIDATEAMRRVDAAVQRLKAAQHL